MISAALIGLLLGLQVNPQTDSGDQSAIQLLTSKPTSCISIPAMQGYSVIFDRTELETMAIPRSTHWKTEEERMQLIRSNRARKLLKSLPEKRDDLNCQVVEKPGDAIYLVLDFINHGHGRIWDTSTKSFLPSVRQRENDHLCLDGFKKLSGELIFVVQVCSI